jgi:DNA-binding transcriptional MerR regulator
MKDLAHLSGQSIYTLKYYLKEGLFEEIGRSPSTNFRYFDDQTLDRLGMIRQLRLQRHSLKQIKDILKQGVS